MSVDPGRWRRRRERDERARFRHEAARLALVLERPPTPWQVEYLADALRAARRGLSPLDAYMQRQAVSLALTSSTFRMMSGC